ncbi:retrovirus-related Pol polyprotein from transposon opus [Trichonephila clavipes]|nr:retrovirus-related Pol polyprotein from transposon opus [Trichonephila clavipes]
MQPKTKQSSRRRSELKLKLELVEEKQKLLNIRERRENARETATHIGIREAEDWFRPIDLAKSVIFIFHLKADHIKKFLLLMDIPKTPLKIDHKTLNQRLKRTIPNILKENKNCFICGDSSHCARDCEKRFKPKESNDHIHNRINVNTLKVESEKQNSDECANLQYILLWSPWKYRCGSVRSEWPLWHAAKTKQSSRFCRRSELKLKLELVEEKQKLLNIREENARVYLQVDDHVHPGNCPAAVSSEKKKQDLLHMEFYHHLPSWAMNEQMSYFSSFSDEWSRDLKTTKEIPVVFKYRNSVHVVLNLSEGNLALGLALLKMAFLIRSKKVDLIQLARDLDESPDPSMSKIVLRDLIISSKYYKEEEAKELLEVITAERLETEQQQKLEQQEQLSIEKLRLEIELSRNANQSTTQNNGQTSRVKSLDEIVKMVRLLTVKVPNKSDGWDYFFSSLEKAFASEMVSDELKPKVLLCMLGDKVSNLLVNLGEEELKDYESLKQVVLKEYEPSPQKYV